MLNDPSLVCHFKVIPLLNFKLDSNHEQNPVKLEVKRSESLFATQGKPFVQAESVYYIRREKTPDYSEEQVQPATVST